MPRLLPEHPTFGPGLRAEQALWEALKAQLPDEALLAHGHRIQDGRRELESDIVVGYPGAGVAVIEVKGGAVRRQAGEWQQRQVEGWAKVDPVRQAQDCRHALQRLLVRDNERAAYAAFVHMVGLPDTAVEAEFSAPDCPRALVVAKQDLHEAAGRVLRALREHGKGHGPLDVEDVDGLVRALAGDALQANEVVAFDAQNDEHVRQLTEGQSQLLDFLAQHRRAAIVGGAGSGKTWLALEKARRLAKDGQRVALVCYSRGLARHLQRQVAMWPRRQQPAFVGLFHELPVLWGAPRGEEDNPTWWEETLPRLLGELAVQRPVAERFDAVVVDEAQDFSAQWWPPTLQTLKDPETGGLFVFLDEGQRIFGREGSVPIDVAPFTLTRNLRNTRRIAQVFGSLAVSQQNYEGLEGPPVTFVACPTEDALSAADDEVDKLLDEGWPAGSIALLATKNRHPIQVEVVQRRGWEQYWDDFFAADDVFYGHVLGFKGLERPAVVLAVNGFRDLDRAKEMLYVGLSRGRSRLVVCGDADLIGRVGGEAVRGRLAGG